MDILSILLQFGFLISLALSSQIERNSRNLQNGDAKLPIFNRTKYEERIQKLNGRTRLRLYKVDPNKKQETRAKYKKVPKQEADRIRKEVAQKLKDDLKIMGIQAAHVQEIHKKKGDISGSFSAMQPQYHDYEDISISNHHDNSNDIGSGIHYEEQRSASFTNQPSAIPPPQYPDEVSIGNSINNDISGFPPPSYSNPSNSINISPGISYRQAENTLSSNSNSRLGQPSTSFSIPPMMTIGPIPNNGGLPLASSYGAPGKPTPMKPQKPMMMKPQKPSMGYGAPRPPMVPKPPPNNGMMGSKGGYSQNGQDGSMNGMGMPYSFEWSVLDPASGNDYLHRESSDGQVTEGQYEVLLPDGRRQIVTFRVEGDSGYVADVRYEGEANQGGGGGGGGGGGNNGYSTGGMMGGGKGGGNTGYSMGGGTGGGGYMMG